MAELEAKAKDYIENHTHKLVNKPTKQDIYLREESIFISGYKLGAEENGVQWHDLRKNPDDLPTDYRSVWTNQGGAYYDSNDKRWADGDSWVYNVIAWCEPQFKEKK